MSEQLFHIVSVQTDGLHIIGPFSDEAVAAQYGNANIGDPRWNVANIGEPVESGMILEDDFNLSSFVVRVEPPEAAGQ